METKNLADLYSMPTLAWADVAARMAQPLPQAPGGGGPDRHTCWLTTLNPDGSPHVTGIGALWARGGFWFETGASTRKGRNVARDPRCALSVSTAEYDLTVEGRAELIDDPALVAEMAALWAVEWPCRVDESGVALTADFSAPSAGRPPWRVYRLTATAATALGTTDPGGATRWQF